MKIIKFNFAELSGDKRNQKPNVGIVEEFAPTSIESGLPTKKVHKPTKNFLEK